jgi:hypothetical protein
VGVYFFISPVLLLFFEQSYIASSSPNLIPKSPARQWDFGQSFGGNARRHGHNSQTNQTRNENSTLPVNDS